jgi:hypothetical protein
MDAKPEEVAVDLEARVKRITDTQARRDLMRMLRVAQRILAELDRERVRCRRLQKPTLAYQELHKKALQQLDCVEKNLLMATLIFS